MMSAFMSERAASPSVMGSAVPIEEMTRAQIFSGARRPTQEEQNRFDDEKRRRAMKELVTSWLERLQLISVITTFFASTEAVMLGITTREVKNQSTLDQAANAAFLGSLVLHVSAAIVSFMGAFFLINYKVHEARKEEIRAEGKIVVEPPDKVRPPGSGPALVNQLEDPPVWSTNPHLVQVGPFHTQPPTSVLKRTHSLSVFLASTGFGLAVTGIVCFAWARHAASARVFCSVCIGMSFTLAVGILTVPDNRNHW